MNVCFITTLISNPDSDMDSPGRFKKFADYDFFLFTNLSKDKLKDVKGWTVMYIDDASLNIYAKIEDLSDPRNNIFKSRYVKFMGWDYLKTISSKKYDVIYYCDTCYVPNLKIDWKKYNNKIINSKSGILQKLHPKNICPIKECDNIFRSKKDSKHAMSKLKTFLRNMGCINKPIMENTSFGYNPNNQKITNAFQDFWDVYTEKKISYRDQPLWGYISQKHNINPVLESNLHYVKNSGDRLLFNCTGTNFKKNRRYNHIFNKPFLNDAATRK